jgi:excinuclease UvrABC nuclease subunit
MRNPEPISTEFIKRNLQSGRPQIMGVYFLIYRKELIYIGSSKDIHIRLKHHKKHSFFKFDKYAIYPVTKWSDEDAMSIERACIKEYKPKYNVMCNPDYEAGNKRVWFTFVSQWKSYRKIAEECNLPIAMVERVVDGFPHKKDEVEIIENTVLTRETSFPVSVR